jgi:hypothetical protein
MLGGNKEEEDEMLDDCEEMILELEQEQEMKTQEATEDMLIEKDDNSGSFTAGFNNQQFKTATSNAPWQGANQQ